MPIHWNREGPGRSDVVGEYRGAARSISCQALRLWAGPQPPVDSLLPIRLLLAFLGEDLVDGEAEGAHLLPERVAADAEQLAGLRLITRRVSQDAVEHCPLQHLDRAGEQVPLSVPEEGIRQGVQPGGW